MTDSKVRHGLRGRPFGPLWFAAGTAGALVLIVVRYGFSWNLILAMPALMAVIFLIIELAYRRNNYAIFHDEHVDIRLVDWGDRSGGVKLKIPYSAIRSARADVNGVVELELDLTVLPDKAASRMRRRIQSLEDESEEGGQPNLLLHARDPHGLVGEFTRRVGASGDPVRWAKQEAGRRNGPP